MSELLGVRILKHVIQKIIGKNTYLNNFVYDLLFYNKSLKVDNYCKQSGCEDYLENTDWLKRFVYDIKNGKINFHTSHVNRDNLNIYGIWEALFHSCGIEKRIVSPCIEHGLFFQNEVFRDVTNTARMTCVTFSNFRKEIIHKKVKIPVFCAGPYINYADDFYTKDKMLYLKQKFGKTLLVFPTHSTEWTEITFDQQEFCKILAKKAIDYNTVLINVFWWNINDPLIKKLESEGYKIISCGFRDDTNFLPRLKSYFSLADLVLGDSIGTHIGYSVACGVPFCYEPVGTITHLFRDIEKKDADFSQYNQLKIAGAFLHAEEITKKQQEICNYYWGNNLRKNDKEIQAIVNITKDLDDITYGFTSLRWSAANALLKKYYDTDEFKYYLLNEAL